MQNTVEIERTVITRPARINTHTHTHSPVSNSHDFMFVICTLSSPSFALTDINRMMETHREKYYANYSPTQKCFILCPRSLFLSLSAPSLSKFLPLCCQPGLEKQLCGVAGEIFWVQSSRFFCHCLLFSFTLKLQLFPLCVLLSVCLIRLYASLHLSPSLSSYSSARSCLLFAAQINTRALPVPENQVKSIKQMSH